MTFDLKRETKEKCNPEKGEERGESKPDIFPPTGVNYSDIMGGPKTGLAYTRCTIDDRHTPTVIEGELYSAA